MAPRQAASWAAAAWQHEQQLAPLPPAPLTIPQAAQAEPSKVDLRQRRRVKRGRAAAAQGANARCRCSRRRRPAEGAAAAGPHGALQQRVVGEPKAARGGAQEGVRERGDMSKAFQRSAEGVRRQLPGCCLRRPRVKGLCILRVPPAEVGPKRRRPACAAATGQVGWPVACPTGLPAV